MTEQENLAAKLPFLELRCRVLQSIRHFFLEDGFLEVQTPLRTAEPAPETHIDAIPADPGYFLATSPELYMKRLLAAGYQKIFQLCHAFRQNERGRYHHPEFTLLEWYHLNADYKTLQIDCQRLLERVCSEMKLSSSLAYQGRSLEIHGSWTSYTVREAFAEFAGWEPSHDIDQNRFDMDLVEKVEHHLGFPRPCFLIDYPATQAALARLKPGDSSVAERFELYWAGLELANGFSELTDPDEQRLRFRTALAERKQAGLLTYPLPEAFLRSMEYLSPCAGIALGVDRLVMILADANRIDDVVAFPPEAQGTPESP